MRIRSLVVFVLITATGCGGATFTGSPSVISGAASIQSEHNRFSTSRGGAQTASLRYGSRIRWRDIGGASVLEVRAQHQARLIPGSGLNIDVVGTAGVHHRHSRAAFRSDTWYAAEIETRESTAVLNRHPSHTFDGVCYFDYNGDPVCPTPTDPGGGTGGPDYAPVDCELSPVDCLDYCLQSCYIPPWPTPPIDPVYQIPIPNSRSSGIVNDIGDLLECYSGNDCSVDSNGGPGSGIMIVRTDYGTCFVNLASGNLNCDFAATTNRNGFRPGNLKLSMYYAPDIRAHVLQCAPHGAGRSLIAFGTGSTVDNGVNVWVPAIVAPGNATKWAEFSGVTTGARINVNFIAGRAAGPINLPYIYATCFGTD